MGVCRASVLLTGMLIGVAPVAAPASAREVWSGSTGSATLTGANGDGLSLDLTAI